MTVEDKTIINVRNMTNQIVVYIIEEDNVRRRFTAQETKKIEAKELRKLYYIDGGDILLKEYLCVLNKELAEEFGVPSDMIEYYWTKEDVDDMLLNGSVESLQDAIEFGPLGISDIIKERAVVLDLNDLAKRKVIDEMLNINLDSMTEIYKEGQEEIQTEPSHRRVQPTETSQGQGRRVQQ